jgi:hypothetical protein
MRISLKISIQTSSVKSFQRGLYSENKNITQIKSEINIEGWTCLNLRLHEDSEMQVTNILA